MDALGARTLALAGVHQAAWLVHAEAYGGAVDPVAATATLSSLYAFDPVDAAATFGGVDGLRVGLRTLRALLGGSMGRDARLLHRYANGVLVLERRVRDDATRLAQLRRGCERARSQSEHLGALDPAVIATLADTWVRTLGTIEPRIMVEGLPQRLDDRAIAARIRALLLGGLRAAVLWHQVGGSRWSLLFGRRALLRCSARLLRDSTPDGPVS